MEWTFTYLGEYEGQRYFNIRTQTKDGRGRDVDMSNLFYRMDKAGLVKSIGEIYVPMHMPEPSREEARKALVDVHSWFGDVIPMDIKIMNP